METDQERSEIVGVLNKAIEFMEMLNRRIHLDPTCGVPVTNQCAAPAKKIAKVQKTKKKTETTMGHRNAAGDCVCPMPKRKGQATSRSRSPMCSSPVSKTRAKKRAATSPACLSPARSRKKTSVRTKSQSKSPACVSPARSMMSGRSSYHSMSKSPARRSPARDKTVSLKSLRDSSD